MPRTMEINFVIPCDQIRREDNGKLIAIGIYGENITIQQAPLVMEMSFIMWAAAEDVGEYEAEIEVFLEPELNAVASFKFGFTATQPSDRIAIPMPPLPLNIGGAGSLVMKQKIGEERKEILRFPIIRADPNASQPPS